MTKKIIPLLLALFALSGCHIDKVVSRVEGKPTDSEQRVSCHRFGYCVACALGFDGKFNCGPKFSASCPGNQRVLVRTWPVTVTLESGKVRNYERTDKIQVLEACK